MSRPHRSWTPKGRLDMVKLNLKQQLDILDKFYPNYERSRLMLAETINSFDQVIRLPGGTGVA